MAMVTPTAAPASIPEGQRVYAVGDVHGCADRLLLMHRVISADLRSRPVADPWVIHLGDYVDRGPDSAGVIERLLTQWPAPAPRVINLLGNHEEMMLAALDAGDAETAANWLANGGEQALTSWGVPRRSKPRDWIRAVPREHVDFVRGLSLRHVVGGYIFVHAGLRPGVPLERQSRMDMLWIREPFLSWPGEFPGVVVHGHTPQADIAVRPNRIGIDTGAVMGGPLTCLVLEGDTMGFLRA
jgi:serine/threonine protein phosphatase 1